MNHFLRKQEGTFICYKHFSIYSVYIIGFFLCMIAISATRAHAQENFEHGNFASQNSAHTFMLASADTKAIFDSFMGTGATLKETETQSSENPPVPLQATSQENATIQENAISQEDAEKKRKYLA